MKVFKIAYDGVNVGRSTSLRGVGRRLRSSPSWLQPNQLVQQRSQAPQGLCCEKAVAL